MKQLIKASLRKFPLAFNTIGYFYRIYESFKLNKLSTNEVFSNIYKNNEWGDSDSVSGPGSNLEETSALIKNLPILLQEFQITSILDIPCGDYHWMNTLKLDDIEYIGADIVEEIVKKNGKYERDNVRFQQLDLIRDKLPAVELIFVRDCFVHLCFDDLFKALTNICKSNARYLLTTTFTARSENDDIATGQWRTLNFQIAPFNFPEPKTILNEGHPDPEWKDKSLGLWEISGIKNYLARMG